MMHFIFASAVSGDMTPDFVGSVVMPNVALTAAAPLAGTPTISPYAVPKTPAAIPDSDIKP